MDFNYSPEEDFRKEVRDRLLENMKELPDWYDRRDIPGPETDSEGYHQFTIWWHHKLYEDSAIPTDTTKAHCSVLCAYLTVTHPPQKSPPATAHLFHDARCHTTHGNKLGSFVTEVANEYLIVSLKRPKATVIIVIKLITMMISKRIEGSIR